MQASEYQFKVGDKAVYPAQGVAEVVDIEEKDIAGHRQHFYVLRILDTDRKIMVPVANADAVGLRQVISEQEIQEIFDILRERTIAFDNQTWNRRYRGFMDKIKTGSIYDVAEVLRDLYRLKTDKQLSFGERRMLDTARGLIVKEIAIAREQTEEDVQNEIESIFFTNRVSVSVKQRGRPSGCPFFCAAPAALHFLGRAHCSRPGRCSTASSSGSTKSTCHRPSWSTHGTWAC
jgi:CarD family transcriptional regulator